MKKTLFVTLTAVFSSVLFLFSSVWVCKMAAGHDFTNPIPVGSNQNQTAGGVKTKSDAGYIKFFKHPKNDTPMSPTPANFQTETVKIPPVTGAEIPVDDLAGTPGLLRSPLGNLPGSTTTGGMLDDMITELVASALGVAHGFCPERFNITSGSDDYGFVSECNALADTRHLKNKIDRQFEVADIRNTIPDDAEFTTLFGRDPLEAGLIGDAEDGLSPYTADLYPAFIQTDTSPSGDPFAWPWSYLTGGGPSVPPSRVFLKLEEPYTHVYAYDVANLPNEGLITAIYDPVNIEKKVHVSMYHDSTPPADKTLSPSDMSYYLFLKHFSPLAFFRKDAEKDRLRLAGYSSWQFKDWAVHDPDSTLSMLFKLFVGMNFSPIAVDTAIDAGKQLIAVVNQATLGDIDRYFLDDNGIPLDFPDGNKYKWRELIGTILGSSFTPLPDTGSAGNIYLPHNVVSWVTLGEKKYSWTNDSSASSVSKAPTPDYNPTDNPNEIFDFNAISLVGPGMFDSDVMFDNGQPALIVASGDYAKDNASLYIYKIRSGDDNKLYFKASIFGGFSDLQIGFAAEPYKVKPPEQTSGDKYVPYGIEAGNFDSDKCGDVVLTWRGAETVWEPPSSSAIWFYNHEGDKVRFRNARDPNALEMFSECITVLYGKDKSGKCVFADPSDVDYDNYVKQRCFGAAGDEPKWQIAAAAVGDINNDGKEDIVVGNLNPMKIAGDYSDAGKRTAYAALLINDGTRDFINNTITSDPETSGNYYLRLGFGSSSNPLDSSDAGQYLVNVWKDSVPDFTGIAGVGDLDIDSYGNIASRNGLPIMLPSFGCPRYSTEENDTRVLSPIEIYWSLIYNARNPGVSWYDGNIMPMRCVRHILFPSIDRTFTPVPACIRPTDLAMSTNCSCPSDMSTSPSNWMLTDCCVGCDSDIERTNFSVYCNWLEAACPSRRCCPDGCCPSSALDKPKDELFAESTGDSGSGSDFAKCDHVYDSKAPYIAERSDLKYAAGEGEPSVMETSITQGKKAIVSIDSAISPELKEGLITLLTGMGMPEADAAKAVEQLQGTFTGRAKKAGDVLIAPLLEMLLNQARAPVREGEALLERPLDKKKTSLIREAWANTISDSPRGVHLEPCPPSDPNCKSKFRFARGHVPPGHAELTVVTHKTPPPPSPDCGDSHLDPGEECEAPLWDCMGVSTTLTCNRMTCQCEETASLCGNGVRDAGEECERGIDCPAGEICDINCHCVPPPPTTGDGCPDCCPPCCPPTCDTCSRPSAEEIKVTCVGGSSPSAIEKIKKMNELARMAAPGLKQSDIFCEADYGKFVYTMNVPGGAAPTLATSDLLSSSISPMLSGNVGNFAMVHVSGTKTKDFTQDVMLPVKTDMIPQPTILLPVSSDISTSFGKATTVPVDLSMTTGVTPYGLDLSTAAPIASSDVTKYDVLSNNTLTLNNVVTLKVTGANDTARGAGEIGNAFIEASLRGQPLLCSWSARCPDSEAVTDSAKNFGSVDFNQVLNVIRDNASECQNGTCSPRLFQKLSELAGWPAYTMNTIAFVQGKVAKAGETPEPPSVQVVPTAFGPPMEAARGGGCKCDMTASAPHAASIAALLVLIAAALGGFVFVRARSKTRS
jgi:hypothetical protein